MPSLLSEFFNSEKSKLMAQEGNMSTCKPIADLYKLQDLENAQLELELTCRTFKNQQLTDNTNC